MLQIRRRFTAWLAALALLFASAALPMLHGAQAKPGAADHTTMQQDMSAHAGMDHTAMDHSGMNHAAMAEHEHGQTMPAADCGNDCGLCLNCALCSLHALPQSLPGQGWRNSPQSPGKAVIEPASHIAALPAEPPQI